MSTPRVGIELIIYGQRQQTDLDGVLGECQAAGYVGVEGGNLSRFYEPAQIKELFARHGLLCAGVHVGYGDTADETKLRDNLAFTKTMGARYLICSGVADSKALAGYDQSVEAFNRAGALCQSDGVTFCYHNHAFEFEPLEGGIKGIHRLAERTDPAVVKFNIDVYWVAVGGEDPAAFVRKYANRAGYFHFKDGAPGSFTELGRGKVDLKASLAAALDVGADWIIYEQDRTDRPVFTSVTESREYLRTLGV
ncbi:MAG: sugar phosphate isomerase/epimerase [Candidatus Latescibacteria bacterium]|nr:sugar phosphate isomerase/epimerase [Candidatus Latescibacterota bacterium]